ncbi:imelysin family protein [Haliangium ochraceum]|uniref:Peptidase M75, Imelysin n=1 Tax=Haliangium ochraceum (strain DSM 14365 / JCM 11303 / SMP-2) TaxID=502025 RepID=D0LZA5_HALO1|nr:imelysin family protein [Haliangium ochraceum]ACY16367.1 Peptidase M75, Imelysin [Haliangium ochraceum DSM 14365]
MNIRTDVAWSRPRGARARRLLALPLTFALLPLGLAACGDDGGDTTPDIDAGADVDAAPPVAQVSRAEVVEHYATIVHANYKDALDRALHLQSTIDLFLAEPTASRFETVKRAWLEARVPYGQSEAYRFYEGPIDDADGPEGQLNAWPMDEAYVDYVIDPQTEETIITGIVNDPEREITKEALASLNEGGEGDIFDGGDNFDPEKAVSTGYHAIEFLLWGQDLNDEAPGERPFQDYLASDDPDATAPNGERRGEYLKVVTELLIDDLSGLVDAWAPDTADNYRASFTGGDPDDALRDVLSGIGVLSKGELGAERMDVALRSLDQEDEHSCFSDNTHVDIAMNAQGIQNVYLGRYSYLSGPSISDLVRQEDPALDAEMRAAFEKSLAAVQAIPVPFDQNIDAQGSEGWNLVNEAVNALFDQSETIIEVGEALGLGNVSVDLPE